MREKANSHICNDSDEVAIKSSQPKHIDYCILTPFPAKIAQLYRIFGPSFVLHELPVRKREGERER